MYSGTGLFANQIQNLALYGPDPQIPALIDYTAGVTSGNMLYDRSVNAYHAPVSGNVIPVLFNASLTQLLNNNGVNLSGQLTATGAALLTDILNLSGNTATILNLTASGQALLADIIGLSGFTVSQLNALSGYITGSPTVNALTVTSGLGVGGIAPSSTIGLRARAMTAANNIAVSANDFALSQSIQLIPNMGGTSGASLITSTTIPLALSARNTLTDFVLFTGGAASFFNTLGITGAVTIGSPQAFPFNPLNIASGSTGYMQVTLQNTTTSSGASTDVVVTSDSGSDSAFYANFGINSSTFLQNSGMGSGFDGYLYTQGATGGNGTILPGRGNLYVGTTSSGTFLYLFAGNSSGRPSAVIDSSGINLPSGNTVRLNNTTFIASPSPGVVQLAAPNGRVGFPITAHTWNAAALTMTAPVNAPAIFNASNAYITYMDFGGYTGARLILNMNGTAGTTSGGVYVGYSNVYTNTAASFSPLCTNNVPVSWSTASAVTTSGFQPIVPGAMSGVYVALLQSGGNAVLTPHVGLIRMDLL